MNGKKAKSLSDMKNKKEEKGIQVKFIPGRVTSEKELYQCMYHGKFAIA